MIESSVMADGSIVLTGTTEYETSYHTNEVIIEWEAVLVNDKIKTLDARVVKGWEPAPLSAIHYDIHQWIEDRKAKMEPDEEECHCIDCKPELYDYLPNDAPQF